MEPKKAMKKTIFKVAFYYFTITNISEKSITISAVDSPIKSIMILQKVLVKSFNATIKQ
jgi:copper(I)-binding protein